MNEFDLFTYVVEIERILNNRPITKLPNSPDDWTALSPSAILSGSLADDVKFDSFMKADAYRHSWNKTEYLADKFWKQWLNQYLPLLQPKQKWFGSSPNMVPGDLVLMMDEATPRGQWPKAIVVENLPDKRGLVRRACANSGWFHIPERHSKTVSTGRTVKVIFFFFFFLFVFVYGLLCFVLFLTIIN